MMTKTYPALAALAVACLATSASAEKIKFDYWYGLTGDLGEAVAETCNRFNASQDKYEAGEPRYCYCVYLLFPVEVRLG